MHSVFFFCWHALISNAIDDVITHNSLDEQLPSLSGLSCSTPRSSRTQKYQRGTPQQHGCRLQSCLLNCFGREALVFGVVLQI